MLRLRDCAPLPQDCVHVDHALKPLVRQCTGQAPWLHACVSAVCGHAVPPQLGCVTCGRDRDRDPAPHEVEHVLHPVKSAALQLTGQQCVLNCRVSAKCGHALPP